MIKLYTFGKMSQIFISEGALPTAPKRQARTQAADSGEVHRQRGSDRGM